MATEFSRLYDTALEEARAHHASSKTYSGKFLRPHAPFIRTLIEKFGARTLLDYGCGKGAQYSWVSDGDEASIPGGQTIEQYWGLEATKYDPAYPPFAAEPVGLFDVVVCTHVLGSIPTRDLADVLERLFGLAKHCVYIAEKIGPVGKQVFSAPEHFPRWSSETWRAFIAATRTARRITVPCFFAARERTGNGILVTRSLIA